LMEMCRTENCVFILPSISTRHFGPDSQTMISRLRIVGERCFWNLGIEHIAAVPRGRSGSQCFSRGNATNPIVVKWAHSRLGSEIVPLFRKKRGARLMHSIGSRAAAPDATSGSCADTRNERWICPPCNDRQSANRICERGKHLRGTFMSQGSDSEGEPVLVFEQCGQWDAGSGPRGAVWLN
jgi:hypothetical protein